MRERIGGAGVEWVNTPQRGDESSCEGEPKMNSSPKRASEPSGKPRPVESAIDLATARQMLPYIRSIVVDVVKTRERLVQLEPEREALDDVRRNLGWSHRQRRYAVHEEVQRAEESINEAVGELNTLGVKLSDAENGAVDFPTRINNRPAAFSWRLGEDALRFWHYAGEELRRPIPVDWHATGTLSRYRSEQ